MRNAGRWRSGGCGEGAAGEEDRERVGGVVHLGEGAVPAGQGALLHRAGVPVTVRLGDARVIERTFGGKRVETRLPVDLEWLWSWMQLATAACDQLAVLSEH